MQFTLMEQLRAATQSNHRSLESLVDIPARLQSRASYIELLHDFYGLYHPLEEQIAITLLPVAPIKTHNTADWLLEDIHALQPNHPLPQDAMELPDVSSIPRAIGCMYVLLGSMLGGQMIAKMVRDQLGYHAEHGARFFHGYGKETMQHWREFGAKANTLAGENEIFRQNAVDAACETFDAFGNWLTVQSLKQVS